MRIVFVLVHVWIRRILDSPSETEGVHDHVNRIRFPFVSLDCSWTLFCFASLLFLSFSFFFLSSSFLFLSSILAALSVNMLKQRRILLSDEILWLQLLNIWIFDNYQVYALSSSLSKILFPSCHICPKSLINKTNYCQARVRSPKVQSP